MEYNKIHLYLRSNISLHHLNYSLNHLNFGLLHLNHYNNYYNDLGSINQSLDGVSLYLSSIHNVDQVKAYRQNQLITITGKFVAKSGIDGGNTELLKINEPQIAVNDTLI